MEPVEVLPSHTDRKEKPVKTLHDCNAEKIVKSVHFNELLRVQMCDTYAFNSVQICASHDYFCAKRIKGNMGIEHI